MFGTAPYIDQSRRAVIPLESLRTSVPSDVAVLKLIGSRALPAHDLGHHRRHPAMLATGARLLVYASGVLRCEARLEKDPKAAARPRRRGLALDLPRHVAGAKGYPRCKVWRRRSPAVAVASSPRSPSPRRVSPRLPPPAAPGTLPIPAPVTLGESGTFSLSPSASSRFRWPDAKGIFFLWKGARLAGRRNSGRKRNGKASISCRRLSGRRTVA